MSAQFTGAARRRGGVRGSSLVEFALVLPVMLMLVLGVIDFGRALQFNNMLTAMSREGAHLAARTTSSGQSIISALEVSAAPLDMTTSGAIYITTLTGRADGKGVVASQTRPTSGDRSLASRVYGCPGWTTGGTCVVPTPAPAVALDGLVLLTGESVQVVETEYTFAPLTGFVMTAPLRLYSKTVL